MQKQILLEKTSPVFETIDCERLQAVLSEVSPCVLEESESYWIFSIPSCTPPKGERDISYIISQWEKIIEKVLKPDPTPEEILLQLTDEQIWAICRFERASNSFEDCLSISCGTEVELFKWDNGGDGHSKSYLYLTQFGEKVLEEIRKILMSAIEKFKEEGIKPKIVLCGTDNDDGYP